MDIQSIAVLGAGSAGLAVAKFLLAEKKFSRIDIYEQRTATGGVWNASRADYEPNFTIPRTTPTKDHEYAFVIPASDTGATGLSSHVELVSPVYDQLETNIPFSLMNYADFQFPADTALFPEHHIVLAYLQQYGRAVESLIIFETQVQDVRKVTTGQDGLKSLWKVESKNLKSGTVSSNFYDAVVVASGHYSDPFVPSIPGITEFDAAHPGVIMHSKFYRRPEEFSGKKVIVVGNSASGLDISSQIATASQLPVLISEKAVSEAAAVPPSSSSTSWSRHIGEITELIPQSRAVRLSTGAVEQGIDAIIFCTGYLYSFPFLQNLNPTVITPDGTYTEHLWQHLLYSKDPSLAFLTIPKRIVPFPLAEAQSAVVARMWAGRLPVPTEMELSAWVAKRAAETTPALRHTLSYPQDRDYINNLHALCQQAKRDGTLGLENDGAGKTPPYWDEETSWVRSNIFHIKAASRALGESRKDCRTLADLGFDYEASKAENAIA